MRRIVFLLCMFSFGAFGQKHIASNKFTLTGKITGRDTGSIVVVYINNSAKAVVDTLKLTQGKFVKTGYIEGISHLSIYDKGFGSSKNAGFYIQPGNTVVILSDSSFAHPKITGSIAQKDFEIISVRSDQSAAYVNYVRTHPSSYLSAGLMYNAIYGLPADTSLAFFKSLDFKVRNSSLGIKVLSSLKMQIQANKSYVTGGPASVGTYAPTFNSIDLNGDKLNLESYKDKKYVLLDFWASWCGPCRALPPYYKKIYANYAPKDIEIISISLDKNKKDWQDAIIADGLGAWKNIVVDPDKSSLLKNYNIQTIPVAILIDKEGKIIFRSKRVGEIMLLGDTIKEIIK